ncbi:unnamed protein product [Cylicocyclus nassatus]|uniref:Uncharacterized protein n=1 Tax=Cylicocyclus nassatus TaxID=53992 RepID=A0AA36GYC3_CYLNA|nr:unnamed protein product [Cylicocyclus nassatus]
MSISSIAIRLFSHRIYAREDIALTLTENADYTREVLDSFAASALCDLPDSPTLLPENQRDVLFVLLPEPFYSYNISEYPFIFVPLFEKALAIAEVKRSDFMKFAETLEKQPQPKTYFSQTQPLWRDRRNYKFYHEKQCFIPNNRKASGGVINRRTPSEDIPWDKNMPPEED